MIKKSSSNTRLYIILGILAFAIIIGTIASSSSKEMFTTRREIVYLFSDKCQHCLNFDNNVWKNIINNKMLTIKMTFTKLNIIDVRGKELATKYGINSVPTIIKLPMPANVKKEQMGKYIISGGNKTVTDISRWVNS